MLFRSWGVHEFLAERFLDTPRKKTSHRTASPPRQFDTRHSSLYQITLTNGKTLGRTAKLPLSITLPPQIPTKKKQGRTIYDRKAIYERLTRNPSVQHLHAPIWEAITPDADWQNVPNTRPFAGLPKFIDRLRMRIMHGNLPIGTSMRYRNNPADPAARDATLCPVCNTRESIQHRFLECEQSVTLWTTVLHTWKRIYPDEEEPNTQTRLFGPSYRKDLDYNQQAIADLLCGHLITTIWDERKVYFDQPNKPPINTSSLIGKWSWKVSSCLNNMQVAKKMFPSSQRRWLRLGRKTTPTIFTTKDWPDQVRELINPPPPSEEDPNPPPGDRLPIESLPAPSSSLQISGKRTTEEVNYPLRTRNTRARLNPPDPP